VALGCRWLRRGTGTGVSGAGEVDQVAGEGWRRWSSRPWKVADGSVGGVVAGGEAWCRPSADRRAGATGFVAVGWVFVGEGQRGQCFTQVPKGEVGGEACRSGPWGAGNAGPRGGGGSGAGSRSSVLMLRKVAFHAGQGFCRRPITAAVSRSMVGTLVRST